MVIIVILFSTLVLAGVWSEEEKIIIKEQPSSNDEEIWIPTQEDIDYQDSMWTIIEQTQSDVDTIKEQIQVIIERLDYPDGTYDSIRYIR